MNTISKGKLHSFNKNYSIYQIDNNGLSYFLSIPNSDHDSYELFLGFPKDDIDTLSDGEITSDIKEVSDLINTFDNEGIYLFCPLPFNDMLEAAHDNDNLLYERLLSRLHMITRDCYNVINENNNVTINKNITIVKRSEFDKKFTNWLEIRLNGYINGINYSSLLKNYENSLFNNTNGAIFSDNDGNSSFGSRTNGTDSKVSSNVKTKKLIKPGKHGYTSFTLIILLMSIFMGIGIGYLLIK